MKNTGHRTVSVVIPTRDRSGELRRALESVRAQTRPAEEVIVVDDGSALYRLAWVQTAFPEVRYLWQPPRGVSAARNAGIREARGEWLAFLDSDDEWRPGKLERQLNSLSASPEHLICHTGEIWIRNGRRVNPKNRHTKSGGSIFQRCLPLCVISPSSVLVHRRLFREVGTFDETLPVCEDYDLWLRICCRYPVLYVDEQLVVKYGGHPDQLSRRYWGMDRFRIRALTKILDSKRLSAEDHQAAVDVLLAKIDVYLTGARKRGKRDEVEEYETLRRRYQDGSRSLSNTGR